MFAEKAMPTPQYELFATAAITPAHLLPWLFKKEKKEKKIRNKPFYYIDTSVLLENIPLVKFIKLHPGPEWFIFHNLTREFIDNVISVIFLRNL